MPPDRQLDVGVDGGVNQVQFWLCALCVCRWSAVGGATDRPDMSGLERLGLSLVPPARPPLESLEYLDGVKIRAPKPPFGANKVTGSMQYNTVHCSSRLYSGLLFSFLTLHAP